MHMETTAWNKKERTGVSKTCNKIKHTCESTAWIKRKREPRTRTRKREHTPVQTHRHRHRHRLTDQQTDRQTETNSHEHTLKHSERLREQQVTTPGTGARGICFARRVDRVGTRSEVKACCCITRTGPGQSLACVRLLPRVALCHRLPRRRLSSQRWPICVHVIVQPGDDSLGE